MTLTSFLIDNECFFEYCENIIIGRPAPYGIYSVSDAFVWRPSKQGHKYWEAIDTKWKAIYKTEKLQGSK